MESGTLAAAGNSHFVAAEAYNCPSTARDKPAPDWHTAAADTAADLDTAVADIAEAGFDRAVAGKVVELDIVAKPGNCFDTAAETELASAAEVEA